MVTPLEYAITNFDKNEEMKVILGMLVDYGFSLNSGEPQMLFNPMSITVALFDDDTTLEILRILFKTSKSFNID